MVKSSNIGSKVDDTRVDRTENQQLVCRFYPFVSRWHGPFWFYHNQSNAQPYLLFFLCKLYLAKNGVTLISVSAYPPPTFLSSFYVLLSGLVLQTQTPHPPPPSSTVYSTEIRPILYSLPLLQTSLDILSQYALREVSQSSPTGTSFQCY